jgi:hypothetical protein
VIKSRKMRWAGHVVLVVERRGAFKVLVGKDARKRTIGKSKLRWERRPNIKLSVQEWWGQARTGLIWLRIGTSGGLL